jgi:hypothetical protein
MLPGVQIDLGQVHAGHHAAVGQGHGLARAQADRDAALQHARLVPAMSRT